MARSTAGFHRMLVSEPAASSPHGRDLVRLFENAGIPILSFADDEAALAHVDARKPGTLLVLWTPSMGWITSAEHGVFFVRDGEHYLNPIVGCQFGCTYCYLMARPHGRLPLRLHVGVKELIDALDKHLENRNSGPSPLFCTGELADSLAELDLYPVAAILAVY